MKRVAVKIISARRGDPIKEFNILAQLRKEDPSCRCDHHSSLLISSKILSVKALLSLPSSTFGLVTELLSLDLREFTRLEQFPGFHPPQLQSIAQQLVSGIQCES
jgi:hypothetical protein